LLSAIDDSIVFIQGDTKMKNTFARISSLILPLLLVAGCGGSSGGGTSPPPPPPPPPPVAMSAAGLWIGAAVTPDIPNVTTGFEFNDADGFTVGTAPFSADFLGGVTETRGIGALYADGLFSWHIPTAGSITFDASASTLSFSTRTVSAGDVATIVVTDEDGVQISSNAVPDVFVAMNTNRDPGAGESLIGSVTINVASGEIVIDALTFGYPSTASSDDVACVIAPGNEFVCVVSDAVSGEFTAGANGSVSVNGSQVTGSGNLYAAPGETLADGSIIAPLTISAGTVAESATLDLTVDSGGLSIDVTSIFDSSYDRGASLATVEAVYTTFDIYGDTSSFEIDATGVISGQTASGCLLSGQVTVIDAAANAYDVNLVADAATCGNLGGTYDGLGVTQDENSTDDVFVFAVFDDGQALIVAEAVK
jgi:hypothetical protein